MPLPKEQFLHASAKAELAGRAADLKAGGVPELLRKAGKEMYNNPVVNTAISLSPGIGDAQAGLEALASAREGDWTGAALNGIGVLPFIPALRTVWHGSPHKFDAFDMSKIGTGEGAQAYGHGLYFADAPEVAKSYRDALKLDNGSTVTTNGEYLAKTALEMSKGDKKKAVDLLTSGAIENTKLPAFAAADSVETMHSKMLSPEGSLYKVDLPDEHIAKMLDWDAPLSQQPHAMEAFLAHVSQSQRNPDAAMTLLQGKTGGEAYQTLAGKNPGLVSQGLLEAGLPGLKYLDQGSRNPSQRFIARSPQGGESVFNSAEEAQQFIQNMAKRGQQFDYVDPNLTRNYVVFDDKIPKILERNGNPLVEALRNSK